MHVCRAVLVQILMVEKVYGVDSYQQYIPLLLYSVVPIVAATLYGFLAKALNDFEEHTTAVRKKNMLVIKVLYLVYCTLQYFHV